MVRGYCGCLYSLLGTQLGPLSTGSVNPSTHLYNTHDTAGCVQNISKKQPLQSVAVCVYYKYNDSYFPTLFLVQLLSGIRKLNYLNISNLYFLKSRNVHTWRVFPNQITYTFKLSPLIFLLLLKNYFVTFSVITFECVNK